jgi:hypothetical protein
MCLLSLLWVGGDCGCGGDGGGGDDADDADDDDDDDACGRHDADDDAQAAPAVVEPPPKAYEEVVHGAELACLSDTRASFLGVRKMGGAEAVNELRALVGQAEDPAR